MLENVERTTLHTLKVNMSIYLKQKWAQIVLHRSCLLIISVDVQFNVILIRYMKRAKCMGARGGYKSIYGRPPPRDFVFTFFFIEDFFLRVGTFLLLFSLCGGLFLVLMGGLLWSLPPSYENFCERHGENCHCLSTTTSLS